MFVLYIVGLVGFGCADVGGKTPPAPEAPAKLACFHQVLGAHGVPHT